LGPPTPVSHIAGGGVMRRARDAAFRLPAHPSTVRSNSYR
jgi:hypothetical protein